MSQLPSRFRLLVEFQEWVGFSEKVLEIKKKQKKNSKFKHFKSNKCKTSDISYESSALSLNGKY